MTMENRASQQQAQQGNRQDVSRLPYTKPELEIYNQVKITLGGGVPKTIDFIPGGGTSYSS